MYDALNCNKYSTFHNALNDLKWNHNFNTRKINVYRLPRARTCVDHGAAFFAAISNWNSLPLSVRSCTSASTFKSAVKHYILNTD